MNKLSNIIDDMLSKQREYSKEENVPIEKVFADALSSNSQKDTNVCPECQTRLTVVQEKRSDTFSEEVAYCNGCGLTSVAK